jgi:hypothetical protein
MKVQAKKGPKQVAEFQRLVLCDERKRMFGYIIICLTTFLAFVTPHDIKIMMRLP